MPKIDHIMADDPLLPPLEKQVLTVLERHPDFLFRKEKKADMQEIQSWLMAPDVPEPPLWLNNSETQPVSRIEHTLQSLHHKGIIDRITINDYECYGSKVAVGHAKAALSKLNGKRANGASVAIGD